MTFKTIRRNVLESNHAQLRFFTFSPSNRQMFVECCEWMLPLYSESSNDQLKSSGGYWSAMWIMDENGTFK